MGTIELIVEVFAGGGFLQLEFRALKFVLLCNGYSLIKISIGHATLPE